jgi:hypothetical protein
VNKEINLITMGASGQVNGIQHVLIGGDRDRVTLIVHVAKGITRVAESALLHNGLAAHGLNLSAKFSSHLSDQIGNARGAQDVHTVHPTTGSLELEGERHVLGMVVLVMLRSHFGVLFTTMMGSGLVRQDAVIVL